MNALLIGAALSFAWAIAITWISRRLAMPLWWQYSAAFVGGAWIALAVLR